MIRLISVAIVIVAYYFSGAIFEHPALQSFGMNLFERGLLPDAITRLGIKALLETRRSYQVSRGGEGDVESHAGYLRSFFSDLRSKPIAVKTQDANEQHYEVDARFYQHVLGNEKKYSSALYPPNTPVSEASSLLDEAEERMLKLYAERGEGGQGAKDCWSEATADIGRPNN